VPASSPAPELGGATSIWTSLVQPDWQLFATVLHSSFSNITQPVTHSTDLYRDTDSPCSKVCTLDDNDICLGCLRSLDEIGVWAGANRQTRLEILDKAAARERALGHNNGYNNAG